MRGASPNSNVIEIRDAHNGRRLVVDGDYVKTHRLLVLGAGFSRLAGLPLGAKLFQEVRKQVTSQYGSDNHVERELKKYAEYQQSCFKRVVVPDAVDCEEFLGYLDVEHYLGLKGKDTWSSEGNEAQLMIRTAIAQVLYALTPRSVSEIPKAYLRFARQLNTSDYILTFNYDTLLERVLDLEGIPFRLFPDRYSEVHSLSCTVDSKAPDELVLIKLHGSIDWFSRQRFDEMEEQVRTAPNMYPAGYRPSHPLFGHDAEAYPMPLTEGPRPQTESLKMLYRVRDLAPILSQSFWKCNPFILAPSSVKLFYAAPLLEFWRGLQRAGGLNLSLGIIGYSLPKYDDYAMQVLYHITRNYLQVEPSLAHEGRQKTKVRIIDNLKTEEEIDRFKVRYQFLDWSRTETYFKGFDEQAADWILR